MTRTVPRAPELTLKQGRQTARGVFDALILVGQERGHFSKQLVVLWMARLLLVLTRFRGLLRGDFCRGG